MLERMILRLLGKEKLDNIKIPKHFMKPDQYKLMYKKEFYLRYGKFQQPIIIDKNNVLIDGYTSYIIAKEYDMKYVKVVRWRF